MKLSFYSFLAAVAVATIASTTQAFVPNNAFGPKRIVSTTTPRITSKPNGCSALASSTTTMDSPPTDTEETFGTVVGDTKGAALRLDGVAIYRGASPLLREINWSVQPNERWGIVGQNGAGKSTLLGAITGTVRMDEGHAYVHSNARVGYLKQSVSSMRIKWNCIYCREDTGLLNFF